MGVIGTNLANELGRHLVWWEYAGTMMGIIQNIWGYEDLVGYNDGNMNGISWGPHFVAKH